METAKLQIIKDINDITNEKYFWLIFDFVKEIKKLISVVK